ncbi:DUF1330 domain-containing protein [Mycobacterium kyogaense]|uniref:DUF1330 domain-containing protein n=1 Tax=Mycobacterium kyogaense TaxID=2212479 RepID=UPI000DAB7D97
MIALDTAALDPYLGEDGGPVVMLNLLRFRPDGGRDTYLEYIAAFESTGVQTKYGVDVLYVGSGGVALSAEPGQDWDMVALVRYPSRQHFVDMINDPEYQRFEHLRADALVEAVLQATTPAAA